ALQEPGGDFVGKERLDRRSHAIERLPCNAWLAEAGFLQDACPDLGRLMLFPFDRGAERVCETERGEEVVACAVGDDDAPAGFHQRGDVREDPAISGARARILMQLLARAFVEMVDRRD